jgi:hypothetical protein
LTSIDIRDSYFHKARYAYVRYVFKKLNECIIKFIPVWLGSTRFYDTKCTINEFFLATCRISDMSLYCNKLPICSWQWLGFITWQLWHRLTLPIVCFPLDMTRHFSCWHSVSHRHVLQTISQSKWTRRSKTNKRTQLRTRVQSRSTIVCLFTDALKINYRTKSMWEIRSISMLACRLLKKKKKKWTLTCHV